MRALSSKPLFIALVVMHMLTREVSAQVAPDVSELALTGGPAVTSSRPGVFGLRGEIQLVVQLVDAPLAVAQGRNAKQAGGRLSPVQQRDYLIQLAQKQDTLLSQIRSVGGRDLRPA